MDACGGIVAVRFAVRSRWRSVTEVTCIGTQFRYQALQPAGGRRKKGAIPVANFDKDDLGNEMRPERGYPSEVQNKAPVWIAGIVIVVAIIGVVAYGPEIRSLTALPCKPTTCRHSLWPLNRRRPLSHRPRSRKRLSESPPSRRALISGRSKRLSRHRVRRKPCNPLKSHKTAKDFFGKAWSKTRDFWRSLEKGLEGAIIPPPLAPSHQRPPIERDRHCEERSDEATRG